jgi:MFS transporter, ACS family, hexuronate transporter
MRFARFRVLAVVQVDSVWVAVGLLALATAGHQGWSCNLLSIPSDIFPPASVASVVGIGGMLGAVGGAIFAYGTGRVQEETHSYIVPFFAAMFTYIVVLLILVRLARGFAITAKLRW